MGATGFWYSDKTACTVVEILSPKRIVVQEDFADLGPDFSYYLNQNYEFSPNPNGVKRTVSLRKNGYWITVGEKSNSTPRFRLGKRQRYDDPHF